MYSEKQEIVLTRQELYDKVWEEPVIKLAKDFGISDVGLGKICRRHKIPLPPRGYWAKVQAGRGVLKRPTLPKGRPIDEKIRILGGQVGNANKIERAGLDTYVNAVPDLNVPQSLNNPHPLIEKTAKILRGSRKTEDLIVPRRNSKILDLHVSHHTLERALCVMDALIKAFEFCDIAVRINAENKTSIKVAEETLHIQIREEYDRVPHIATPAEKAKALTDYFYKVPSHDSYLSGRLTLSINDQLHLGVRQNWSDGKQQQIENCLEKFLVGLFEIAAAIKVDRAERERQRLEWEEQKRRWEIERRRKLLEQERAELLLSHLAAWQKSQEILRFVDNVETKLQSSTIKNPEKVNEWITWANQYANEVNPIFKELPVLLSKKDVFNYDY